MNLTKRIAGTTDSRRVEGLLEMIRVLVNEDMQIEREKYLNTRLYERGDEYNGHVNSYKPKTVRTRIAEVTFNIP